MERNDLKKYCIARLEECADEHPAGHQGKYAARYVMRRASGDEVELMFEKEPRVPANLWLEQSLVSALLTKSELTFRESTGSSTCSVKSPDGKSRYGRHSALKAMSKLKAADLVCFRIEKPSDLDLVLSHLAR